MDVQVVILAAGKGTRMGGELPKVLVELKGKPLIQYLIDSVNNIQTDYKPIIVVGFKHEMVESALGPNYIYVMQEEQLGTGHALAIALPKVEAENILVLYGDKPFTKTETLNGLINKHIENKSMFSMLTMIAPNFENEYATFFSDGRIIRDTDGRIIDIREINHASEQEKQIMETNPGYYIFNRKWLENNIGLIKMNNVGELYLTDLAGIAIKSGINILTTTSNPLEVYGINTPQQLEQADKFLV